AHTVLTSIRTTVQRAGHACGTSEPTARFTLRARDSAMGTLGIADALSARVGAGAGLTRRFVLDASGAPGASVRRQTIRCSAAVARAPAGTSRSAGTGLPPGGVDGTDADLVLSVASPTTE